MDVRAGIDSQGKLVAIDFTNTVPQWGGVTWNAMLAGASPAAPFSWVAFAPGSMYNVPNSRLTVKSIQITGNWISGWAMQSVLGHSVAFAGEQVIDELAHAAMAVCDREGPDGPEGLPVVLGDEQGVVFMGVELDRELLHDR